MNSRSVWSMMFLGVVFATLYTVGCSEDETVIPVPTLGTIEIVASPAGTAFPWSLTDPQDLVTEGTGSTTIEDRQAGTYTLTWGTHTGWVAPAASEGLLIPGETLTLSGTWTTAAGTVVVDISPAGTAAGWTLTGPNGYTHTGAGAATLTDLAIGDYTITWAEVAGHETPAPETFTLSHGTTVTFTGNYDVSTGTIVITPSQPDAGWSLIGPNSYSSSGTGPTTLTGLTIGEYTISWAAIQGYARPLNETAILAADATLTFTASYDLQTGTIVVDPSVADANWTLRGPNSYTNAGTGATTLTDMLVGTYTITWGIVEGYDVPSPQMGTLEDDATLTFSITYGASTGTISIAPSIADAPWSLSGPDAYANDGTGATTLQGVVVGDYTVTWGAVDGFDTPAPETATLARGSDLEFTGTYVVSTGTVEIAPSAAAAPWSLSGPDDYTNSGTGPATIEDVVVGSYTVAWGSIADHHTPAPQTQTLTADATLTFSATYSMHTGTIEIAPSTPDAGWHLTGPDAYATTGIGSTTLAGLVVGEYTITWDAEGGFDTPEPETGTVVFGETLVFTGTYVPHTGTIEIAPSVPEAGWSLAGPDSYSNRGIGAATLNDLPIGGYSITWDFVADHETPAPDSSTLVQGGTLTFTGTYERSTGTIEVAPSVAGAPWSLSGPDAYASSGSGATTLSDLVVGSYTITWGDVADHDAPAEETATLTPDATVTFAGTYVAHVGTIEIAPSLAGASWSLSGPDAYANSGTGPATLTDVTVGEYTIT